MTVLTTVIGRGTTAAKPAAAAVPAGALYFDTDLGTLQRSTGAAWEDCAETTSVSFDDDEGDPAVVSNTAAADGVSTYPARRDHAHLRPAFVGARCSTAAEQSIANNTTTIIDFGTETYDADNLVTTGAAWKFTCPTTGKYSVKACIMYVTGGWASGERGFLAVYKNNALYSYLARKDNFGANEYMNLNGSDTVDCAATDYLDIRTAQNSGGAIALSNDAGYNYVAIERVG